MLNQKLNEIEYKLKIIEDKIDKISHSCTNMDSHISFVDSVYTTVKKPFLKVMRYVDGYKLLDTEDSNTYSSTTNNL